MILDKYQMFIHTR